MSHDDHRKVRWCIIRSLMVELFAARVALVHDLQIAFELPSVAASRAGLREPSAHGLDYRSFWQWSDVVRCNVHGHLGDTLMASQVQQAELLAVRYGRHRKAIRSMRIWTLARLKQELSGLFNVAGETAVGCALDAGGP